MVGLVDVRPALWAYAMIVAEARTQSNAGRRATKDRGAANNAANDITGSFGELLTFDLLRKCRPVDRAALDHIKRCLFVARGGAGASGADVVFGDGSAIDTKTHDMEPRKRYFALNVEKHRLLTGQASHYLCILAPPRCRRALVLRPVPLTDVDAWPAVALGSYGDPSHNLPMSEMVRRYGSAEALRAVMDAGCYDADDVLDLVDSIRVRTRLLRNFPALAAVVDVVPPAPMLCPVSCPV